MLTKSEISESLSSVVWYSYGLNPRQRVGGFVVGLYASSEKCRRTRSPRRSTMAITTRNKSAATKKAPLTKGLVQGKGTPPKTPPPPAKSVMPKGK